MSKSKKNYKIKKIEKGDEFYTFDGYLNHVIDVVTDDELKARIVVYRCWLKYKNRWGFYSNPLAHHLYEQCLLNDLSDEDREKLFEINNIDIKPWF